MPRVTGDAVVTDLNADLAESYGRWRLGDDGALLGVVTSANLACGFHAGDPTTLARACAAAAAGRVAVGAQVSYPDLVGFGRRRMDLDPQDLCWDVVYQVGAVQALARAAGTEVTYLKPHGALYHAAASDAGQAGAVVAALVALGGGLAVVGAPGSQLLRLAAAAGLVCVREGFVDRGYAPDGSLVPRGRPGDLVADPDEVAERAVRMALQGTVVAVDGSVVALRPDTLCLHGDTPGAVALARRVRAALEGAGVRLAPFAPPPAAGAGGASR